MTAGLVLACAAFGLSAGAGADGMPFPPQTRLRVTVLQWMPMKGIYEPWTALGGEFVVSDAGTIAVPVIGSVAVAGMDDGALAAEIAKRIQEKTGLVNRPDTTVEVLEFPPIYVMGDVNKPGEYKFRSGLTVLQAVALSGGELQPAEDAAKDEIEFVGQLQGLQIEMLRAAARIARLKAEMAGEHSISFPKTVAGVDSDLAEPVYAQEQIIFSTRANEIERQTKSLSDLRELFSAEIDVLEEKNKAADMGIKSAETELAGVKTLVDKGLAIASRQSDLERALANYRAERLDQVTAIMRARQNITQATRDLEGLHDKQQTEVASQLQNEQANLDQLKLKRDTSQKLLLDLLARKNRLSPSGAAASVDYTIKRRDHEAETAILAAESTPLMPGDVVEVELPKASPTLDLSGGEQEAFQQKARSDAVSQ